MADRQVGGSYQLYLCDPTGARKATLALTDWTSLDYALSTNAPGPFTLDLRPAYPLVSTLGVASWDAIEDCQVEIWRTPYGGAAYLEGQTGWFVDRAVRVVPAGEAAVIRLTGRAAMKVLDTRVIPKSSKTATKKNRQKGGATTTTNPPAGNAVLRLAREHLGKGLDFAYDDAVSGGSDRLNKGDQFNAKEAALDVSRDLETPGYLTFMAYAGHGAAMKKAFGFRELWDCVTELIEASDEKGSPIAADVVATATNPLRYQVRTYAARRGTDRTASVTLSPDSPHFNIVDVEAGTDWSGHKNFLYVKKPKVVRARPSTLSLSPNPWVRKEALVDASDAETDDEVVAEADAALKAARPKKIFSCRVVNTPASMYGTHWFHGDAVTTVLSPDPSAPAVVEGIRVTVRASEETIDALVRVDD